MPLRDNDNLHGSEQQQRARNKFENRGPDYHTYLKVYAKQFQADTNGGNKVDYHRNHPCYCRQYFCACSRHEC